MPIPTGRVVKYHFVLYIARRAGVSVDVPFSARYDQRQRFYVACMVVLRVYAKRGTALGSVIFLVFGLG